ncbi:MAG: transcriptional regulator GcvA [Rhodospirillales bacterium]
MRSYLPSLNALRAFEAAARLGRVNAAAEELSVTPAAVSHQIKSLEEHFGVPLFRREVRQISLTPTGQKLLPLLSEGFEKLAEACRLIETAEQSGVLVVSAPPTFAAKWLVRSLQDFYAVHPDISVRLDGTIGLTDFDRDDVDVAIRFGAGPYPDLHAVPLLAERVYAVCAPDLATPEKPLDTPDDLRHHKLLHMTWQSPSGLMPDWPMWLKTAGVEGVDTTPRLVFNNEVLAIEAAIAGQGVALMSAFHAKGEIERGRLIGLFDLELPTDFHYWLVCPPAYAERPKVSAFQDWIVEATCGMD